jgi:hypothetical protein
MRDSPFYFEIKDIMTQFVSAFNDIIIKRHDRDRNPVSRVKVRYVYAPKQRVVHDLTNKAKHITLPVVAVNIAGITRDTDRVFNKIEGSYYTSNETNRHAMQNSNLASSDHMLQPVPVDITVNMSILARYQTDVEQIISNFIPYSDPYIVISWKIPAGITEQEQEIRSEVMWSGDMSMDYPDSITSTDPFRLACDTTFTIKTWLFKKNISPAQNIYKITTNYMMSDDTTLIKPYYSVTESSYNETVSPSLTGAPYITNVYGQNIKTIYGYNFGNTTGVYVSGSTVDASQAIPVETIDDPQMATTYPAFTAVEVPFRIINDNQLEVDLTQTQHTSQDDLLIQNAAGYDSLFNTQIGGSGEFLL